MSARDLLGILVVTLLMIAVIAGLIGAGIAIENEATRQSCAQALAQAEDLSPELRSDRSGWLEVQRCWVTLETQRGRITIEYATFLRGRAETQQP